MTDNYKEALVSLRRQLHEFPEVAHQETDTANRIADFLNHFEPDKMVRNLGGNGLAAIYNGKEDGPTIMIRCELDGLPIQEETTVSYRSQYTEKGHLCGHDGHMTMVAGLAPLLSASRPARGRVILLFQPAEETGEGASLLVEDEQFPQLEPDYIFALHNLPGFEESAIILRKGIFASASRGLILKLKGASSHASHPEDGINPSLAAAQIIQSLMTISQMAVPLHEAALVTPIHTRIGQRAFGTSPGEGEVMFTLRTHSNESMQALEKQALQQAEKIAAAHGLALESEWTEPFEAVHNDAGCVDRVERCARNLELPVTWKEVPFPWSEDFGVFTGKYKGALFGLGSGITQPQLHNEKYDFPDSILEKGTLMFYSLVHDLLEDESGTAGGS